MPGPNCDISRELRAQEKLLAQSVDLEARDTANAITAIVSAQGN